MKNVLIFIAGVTLGSAVTWYLVKNKYEQIAKEEIDSVKEVFNKKAEENKSKIESLEKDLSATRTNLKLGKSVAEVARHKPNIIDYAQKLNENRYISDEVVEEKVETVEKPYLIEQVDYGDYDDYSTGTLEYFPGEKILISADDPYEPLDDIGEIIGDVLTEIDADFVNDWIFVRNDRTRTDYEVYINGVPFEEREV